MTTFTKDLMAKKVITVNEGTLVRDAVKVMNEARIRHLPVLSTENEIVGMISQRDTSYLSHLLSFKVEEVMAAPVQFINQNESLRVAALKMLDQKISCLIIVDDSEKMVGIITTDDMLWQLAQELSNEKSEQSLRDYFSLQTIGQIAQQLSQAGI